MNFLQHLALTTILAQQHPAMKKEMATYLKILYSKTEGSEVKKNLMIVTVALKKKGQITVDLPSNSCGVTQPAFLKWVKALPKAAGKPYQHFCREVILHLPSSYFNHLHPELEDSVNSILADSVCKYLTEEDRGGSSGRGEEDPPSSSPPTDPSSGTS